MSSAYPHYIRAPQNVLMLMIYLQKRSARWVIYQLAIYIETARPHHRGLMWVISLHFLNLSYILVFQSRILAIYCSGLLWKRNHLVATVMSPTGDESSRQYWISRWVVNSTIFSLGVWADESSRALLEYVPAVFASPKSAIMYTWSWNVCLRHVWNYRWYMSEITCQ